MGLKQAYVPALAASPDAITRKLRELPLLGTALVKVGDLVSAEDPVLKANLPGEILILRISEQLGFDADQVEKGLKVKIGDALSKGDLVCSLSSFFGLFNAKFQSPAAGIVEYYTAANAHLGLRQESTALEIKAYIDGKIVEVEQSKSVVVETRGCFVQGVFGVGAESYGKLFVLPIPANASVTAEFLKPLLAEIANSILVGGQTYTSEAIQFCASSGVKGVICGSINSETLRDYVGYEIGVSVTGDEEVPFPLIITEGFGSLPISSRVLEVLTPVSGKRCSISGVTQVRAGATRPEIIVPNSSSAKLKETNSYLEIGARIRIIRVPNFGSFGQVIDLPHDPQLVPTGAKVRVLKAKLDNGEEVIVPRANVELA